MAKPPRRPWTHRLAALVRKDAEEVRAVATEPRTRRAFLRGLRAPSHLPTAQKHVLVLVLLGGCAAAWGLGTALLRVLAPGLAFSWDLAWSLAAWGLLTTIVLPLPFEPALFASRSSTGDVIAVFASAVGKTGGAALVFFLGGALRAKLAGMKKDHPWIGGFLDATEDAAKRWKGLALGAMMAVPLFPDSIPLYVFSLLRLPFHTFLAATFVGTVIRSAVVLSLGRATLL